jgi:carbon storage regulator CsrA
MLVLSRKQGQTIELPELQIVVRVIGVTLSRVQLGIEAPEQFAIHRGERIQQLEPQERLPKRTEQAESGLLSRQEADRLLDELVRLETELSAVAELADPANRAIAQRVASDAMQRIEGISRSVRMTLRQRRADVKPISELVRVRAEVLDRLRERSQPKPAECCD